MDDAGFPAKQRGTVDVGDVIEEMFAASTGSRQ